jgi:1,4-dihydroxy-2-naphthoyl-CoA hydrolase
MTAPLPTADELNSWSVGTYVELLGITVTGVSQGRLTAELPMRRALMAPNGYLHAGSVVSLADTTCGYGARAHLPAGAQGFTTIELKTNFLGTTRDGVLECEAVLVHGGRTTQVWDATVRAREDRRTLAVFRCTQLLLYPRAP